MTVLVLLAVCITSLQAQEAEQTIEELYLQSAIKTQVVKTLAAAADRELKMIAITNIAEMIEDGTAASNPEIIPILSDLAGEGVTNIVREQGARSERFSRCAS